MDDLSFLDSALPKTQAPKSDLSFLDSALPENDLSFLDKALPNNASVDNILAKMRDSIMTQESGGSQKVQNPRTSATGLFQVIPANIPKWTRKYYGKALSPQEFANDRTAQETVFKGEMGKYINKALKLANGDEDKAIRMASAAWYGGEGNIHNYDANWGGKGSEPTFREYTTSVLNRIKKNGGMPSLAPQANPLIEQGVIEPTVYTPVENTPTTPIDERQWDVMPDGTAVVSQPELPLLTDEQKTAITGEPLVAPNTRLEQPTMEQTVDPALTEANDANFKAANDYLQSQGQPLLTREQFNAAQTGGMAQATAYQTQAVTPPQTKQKAITPVRTQKVPQNAQKPQETPTQPIAKGKFVDTDVRFRYDTSKGDLTEQDRNATTSRLVELTGVDPATVRSFLDSHGWYDINDTPSERLAQAKADVTQVRKIPASVQNQIVEYSTNLKARKTKSDADFTERVKSIDTSLSGADRDLEEFRLRGMADIDAGLITPEQQVEAYEKLKKDVETWKEDRGFLGIWNQKEWSDVQRFLGGRPDTSNKPASESYQPSGLGKDVQSPKDYFNKAYADMQKQYGSASNWVQTQKEFKKRFENAPMSYLMKQGEAAVGGAMQAPFQGAASALKSIAIGAEAIDKAIGGDQREAKERYSWKLAESLEQLAPDVDKDFNDSSAKMFGNVAGQVIIQTGLGMATGGALAPALFGAAQGATEQYEQGTKEGLDGWSRLGKALVGGLIEAPDYFVFKGMLKGGNALNKISAVQSLKATIEKGLITKGIVAPVAEKMAVAATDGFVAELIAKGGFKELVGKGLKVAASKGKVGGLEALQEGTTRPLNDLWAYISYDPSPERWDKATSLQKSDFVEGVAGFFGGIVGASMADIHARMERLSPEAQEQVIQQTGAMKDVLPPQTLADIQKAFQSAPKRTETLSPLVEEPKAEPEKKKVTPKQAPVEKEEIPAILTELEPSEKVEGVGFRRKKPVDIPVEKATEEPTVTEPIVDTKAEPTPVAKKLDAVKELNKQKREALAEIEDEAKSLEAQGQVAEAKKLRDDITAEYNAKILEAKKKPVVSQEPPKSTPRQAPPIAPTENKIRSTQSDGSDLKEGDRVQRVVEYGGNKITRTGRVEKTKSGLRVIEAGTEASHPLQGWSKGSAPMAMALNASGESSASLEAINRQASEKAQQLRRVVVDTRSGKEYPLIGVDAVDRQARDYESIEFRGGNRNGEVISQGAKVSRAYSPPMAMAVGSKQTDTPEFKKFFGESKVVDKRGKPQRVYRGDASDIGAILQSRAEGIFFTDKPRLADQYTQRSGPWLTSRPQGVITPAYLSMQNPLIIDAQGTRHDNIPVPWEQWQPKTWGNLPKNAVSIQKAFDYAKEHGYDGLIVKNVLDTVYHNDRTKSTVYAVMRSEQVKSAIGNRGTFDPNDPNILRRVPTKPTPQMEDVVNYDTGELATKAKYSTEGSLVTLNNLEAYGLANQAIQAITGKTSHFYGMTLNPSNVAKFREMASEFVKDAGLSPKERTAFNKFVKAIDKAAKTNPKETVRIVLLPDAIAEESAHEARMQTMASEAVEASQSQAWIDRTNARPLMEVTQLAKRYPDPTIRAMELVDKLIAKNYDDLGIDPDEHADEILDIIADWADDFIATNGEIDWSYYEKLNEINAALTQRISEEKGGNTKDTGKQDAQRDEAKETRSDVGAETKSKPAVKLTSREPGKSGLEFDEAKAEQAKADGQKVAAISKLTGIEDYYTPQGRAETEANVDAILGEMTFDQAMTQAMTATPSPEASRVLAREAERLVGVAEAYRQQGKGAEHMATLRRVGELIGALKIRQIGAGREVEIQKMLRPLTPEAAVVTAEYLYQMAFDKPLTETQRETVYELAKENQRLLGELATAEMKLAEAERTIADIDNNIPEKKPFNHQEALLNKYKKRKPIILAELQQRFPDSPVFNVSPPMLMAVGNKNADADIVIDPKTAKLLKEYAIGQILTDKSYETVIRELKDISGASDEQVKDIHATAADEVRGAKEPQSAEAKKRIQIRKEHYTEADKRSGKLDAKAIASARKSLAELQRKIDEQDLATVRKQPVNSTELKALREKQKTLRKELNNLRKANMQTAKGLSRYGQKALNKNPEDIELAIAVDLLSNDKPKSLDSVILELQHTYGFSPPEAKNIAQDAKVLIKELKAEDARARDKAEGISAEQREILDNKRVEQLQAANRLNRFLNKAPENPGLIKRFNDDFRIKLVANWGTQIFNAVQVGTVATPAQILLDIFEIGLRKAGVNIGEETDVRVRDLLLPYNYMLSANRQIAEQALANFPDLYFEVHKGLLGDIPIEPLKLADTKTGLSKVAHQWFDANAKYNEFATKYSGAKMFEMHFRNSVIAAAFDQAIKKQTNGQQTLESVMKAGKLRDYITESIAKRAAKRAMDVTFASEIDDPAGKALKHIYDKLDHYLPVLLNPVTYARFMYSTSKQAVINPLLFGALDSAKLGGEGYSTRSIAKGMLAYSTMIMAGAVLSAIGGDDDKWYTLYPLGKNGPIIDIRRSYPLAAYFYLAHNALQIANDKPIDTDVLGGLLSLETEYYQHGAPMEFLGTVKDFVSQKKGIGDVGESTARLLGGYISGITRAAKPLRDLWAQVDADERAYREDPEGAKDKFLNELSRSIPGVIRLSGQKKQTDLDGKVLEQPFPIGRILGVNVVHPDFTRDAGTRATQWANRLWQKEYEKMTPDEKRAFTLRNQLKKAVRAGQMDFGSASRRIDKYVSEGRLTKESASRLKSELKLSPLEAKVKYEFGDNAKDIKILTDVWKRATDEEKGDIRKILRNKDNVSDATRKLFK
jgi:HAMP domain-containing protein